MCNKYKKRNESEMNAKILNGTKKLNYLTFDSDDNRTSAKLLLALKAIGGGIKDKNGKVIGAGLWMAHENAENMSMEKRLHRFM